MCLYTKQKKPIILDEDLIVYKNCKIDRENRLIGWYVDHHYSKIETAPLKVVDFDYTHKRISSGLHSYVKNNSENTEWVIPKGSKVYFSDDKTTVVSNKLIFNDFSYKYKNDIIFAKPSITRFVKKWYRWFKNDY